MVQQAEFTLTPRSRGFHLVTDEVLSHLPPLPDAGLVHLFVKHTSAGLSINENADPDVRNDLGAIFDRLVGERETYYTHTLEGVDEREFARFGDAECRIGKFVPLCGGEAVVRFGLCRHGCCSIGVVAGIRKFPASHRFFAQRLLRCPMCFAR